MSQWLQEEMKKLGEQRQQSAPGSKHIIITAVVFILIETALLVYNQLTPDYNALPLCGMVGVMGVLIIVIFAAKSKSTPNKPKLPNAAKCIGELCFSPEELKQFDSEMMAAPLALIHNNNRSDLPIIITKHYMAYAYVEMGDMDYRIYRLSDIAMTCYASGRSSATANPLGKAYFIDLLNEKREKFGGLSIDGKKYFVEFNEALENMHPHIKLNVSMKEVRKSVKILRYYTPTLWV